MPALQSKGKGGSTHDSSDRANGLHRGAGLALGGGHGSCGAAGRWAGGATVGCAGRSSGRAISETHGKGGVGDTAEELVSILAKRRERGTFTAPERWRGT